MKNHDFPGTFQEIWTSAVGVAELEHTPLILYNIDGFFDHLLKRLGENPGELPAIINELVTMFVKHKIKIRFYKAFIQIRNLTELIKTLKKISDDSELENFELFCSALFVFYTSKMS